VEASIVLELGRRTPVLGETDQGAVITRVGDMVGSRSMTRLTRLAFEDGPRILTKGLGVERVREVPILRRVTALTGLLTRVGGGLARATPGGGSVAQKGAEYRGESEGRDKSRHVHGSHGESARKPV